MNKEVGTVVQGEQLNNESKTLPNSPTEKGTRTSAKVQNYIQENPIAKLIINNNYKAGEDIFVDSLEQEVRKLNVHYTRRDILQTLRTLQKLNVLVLTVGRKGARSRFYMGMKQKIKYIPQPRKLNLITGEGYTLRLRLGNSTIELPLHGEIKMVAA